ncbi:MAG: THUMP domain-containing protein [Nitrososphaerales archaeon]
MIPSKFNLLVTTYRRAEHDAGAELFSLLIELGDSSPKIEQTGISGLLAVETSIPADRVINEVKKIVESEPWRIRYLLRLIPIECVVDTDLSIIKKAVEQMINRIGENESFRVTVEKRHTNLSSRDIIDAVASLVHRPVNLENPDWIILIEVVNGKTGLSILKPHQILSVTSIKRG